MNSFIQRNSEKVIGVLRGFDRLRFRGTLRRLCYADGVVGYLNQTGVLLKEFGKWSEMVTNHLRQRSEAVAKELGRPLVYLNNPGQRKEDLAKEIAQKDGIKEGLICLLKAVEPCWSYEIRRDPETRKLKLVSRFRKCLHIYHYHMHPELGFLHGRLQTWLPFSVTICINGREWLGRQMDHAGIGYQRRDNCFVSIEDVEKAQQLMDKQLKVNWPQLLNRILSGVNPGHDELPLSQSLQYYWAVDQSEWATDVMFCSAADLSQRYEGLINYGIATLNSREVLRFLGRKVPEQKQVHPSFKGDVVTDLSERAEGIRLKHRVGQNSLKVYNKQGSVLRVETTINNTVDFKVYRQGKNRATKKPTKADWRPMRKSVADIYRRAQVSDAANERYFESLGAAQQVEKLDKILAPLCKPKKYKGKRVRALKPFDQDDMLLLQSISCGEFALNGFRNRDLRKILFGPIAPSPQHARRQSGAVSRKIRLLRAHGIIKKVPRTYRYQLTKNGRQVLAALSAARQASTNDLIRLAA